MKRCEASGAKKFMACIGRYTSGTSAGSTPKNAAGVTPTTVKATLLIRIGWPAALTGPPKRRSL
jgi:hypothetical protein